MDVSRTALALLFLASPVWAEGASEDPWFASGRAAVERARERAPEEGTAKNAILFVGDGMGISTITAARIFEGQQRGESGEENQLSFEALSNAVRTATLKTRPEETLIVVTTDHSHPFTISGYPTRGNDILGKVIGNDQDGKPSEALAKDQLGLVYTTLGYQNGPGYIQEAAIPFAYDTHGGEDVTIHADGPGAALFDGVQEQHFICHAMVEALGWNRTE